MTETRQPRTAACEHRTIVTYAFTDPDHESYGDVAMWACQDCRRKFAPKVVEAAAPQPVVDIVGDGVTDNTDALQLVVDGKAKGRWLAAPQPGLPEPIDGQHDLPNRVVVGSNGAYWREYGTPDALGHHYSMCPVSTDNDPVDIIAVYVPKAEVDRLERVLRLADAELGRLIDEQESVADATLRWEQSEHQPEPAPQPGERERALEAAYKWVRQHPATGGDWACVECHPESDMLREGFRCVPHLALAHQQPTGDE